MGTPCQEVYDAFTSMILEDEWYDWNPDMVEADMYTIMENAIPYFKFPRVSLNHDQNNFESTLSVVEIRIIATFMKIEWLNRTILSWQHLKPLYSEQDFSQANLIDKFTKLLEEERTNAYKLESLYYRSVDGAPFNYEGLAGNSI